MSQNRAVWADLLRILAMFFVVFIHVSPLPQVITFTNILYFINFAIVKTCIAIFFMLSGTFLLSKEESYKTFFQKRFLKVLLPWVFWTIIYMLVQIFIQCRPVKTFSELKYFFELTFLTKFWILPVLAGLYLLTPLFRIVVHHAKPRDLYYLLSLWFIVISLLPFLHNGSTFPISFPAGIFSQVMMCSGFFLGGYMLIHLPKKYHSYSVISGLLFGGLLITILSAFFKSGAKMIDIEGFAYSIFAPGMVILTAGIYLLFYRLEKRFEKVSTRTKKMLAVVSIASFGVYLTHELVNEFIRYLFIPHHVTLLFRTDLITDYFRASIVFLLSLGLVMGIRQIPLLKRIVP